MASSTDQHSGDHPDKTEDDAATAILPPSSSSKADRYRIMAEEVRTAAEEMHDMTSRQTLQRIAEDYDRLANRTERRLRGKPISPGVRNHR
jgi:hypothetical protein